MSSKLKNVVTFLKITICFLLSRPFGSNTGGLVILKSDTVWGLRRVEVFFCFRPLFRSLPLRLGQTGPHNMLVTLSNIVKVIPG